MAISSSQKVLLGRHVLAVGWIGAVEGKGVCLGAWDISPCYLPFVSESASVCLPFSLAAE